jgi:hypothetical protein
MVQAHELRIGNLLTKSLKSGNGRKIDSQIGCEDIVRIYNHTGSFIYEPISITEEWLLKFGFEFNKSRSRFNVFENDAFSLFCSFDQANGFQIWFETELSECPLNLEYIHQLQNLYFALTQKELGIK